MPRPIQILLVEDSASDRFLALEALDEVSTPNRVHSVSDGLEALSFLRHAACFPDVPRPDIILLDLNLPRFDGRKVLAELNDGDLRRSPVLIPAASENVFIEGDTSRPCPEHAQSYFPKPIKTKEMNDFIRIFRELWFPDAPQTA
jgi:two-component system, chemotaxis family, response regulator Rcp1